jgi:hypothetical protein
MLWSRNILFFIFALFPLAAGANHPSPDQMEKVKSIAHELEGETAEAYQTAFQYSGPGWRERYALERLKNLEAAAHHFHQQVEVYFQAPEHTEHDYINLIMAHHDADSTVWDLSAIRFQQFNIQWRNIGRLMSELGFYYGGSTPTPTPAVRVVITQIEQGGNLSDTTVRIRGYLEGTGITDAGVYVDGRLKEMLHLSPLAERHTLYARLKWPRFSGQHVVEIRVRQQGYPEQTVWSRVF